MKFLLRINPALAPIKTQLVIVMICFFMTGCTTLSNYQTARTLPKGSGRVVIGMGYLLSPREKRPIGVSSFSTSPSLELPLIDLGFRTGVEKNIDLGARIDFPASLSFDGKYQFWDNAHFAGAVGLGINYVVLSSELIEENKGIREHYLDLSLPVFFSVDFTRNAGIYMAIPLVLRKDPFSAQAISKLLGTTLGLRFGDEQGIFLETNYLWDMETYRSALQVNIGFFFGNACSAPGLHPAPPTPVVIENISRRTEGTLLRYFPKIKLIAFSHPAYGNWRKTDRICILKENKTSACGTITKVTPHHAQARLNFVKHEPLPGDTVILEK